jgi:hypothetical protein
VYRPETTRPRRNDDYNDNTRVAVIAGSSPPPHTRISTRKSMRPHDFRRLVSRDYDVSNSGGHRGLPYNNNTGAGLNGNNQRRNAIVALRMCLSACLL